MRHLETFPSDARFISDDPGLVWRSGHDTPGDFADTSYQRLDDRSITQASLVKAASADDVCGVIVTSPRTSGASAACPTHSPRTTTTRCSSAMPSRSTSATRSFCSPDQ